MDQLNANDIDSFAQELPAPISTQVPLILEQSTIIPPNTSNHQSLTPFEYGTYSPISDTHRQTEPYQPIEIMRPTDFSKPSVVSTSYPWSIPPVNSHAPTITYSTNGPGDNECRRDGFMGDDKDCRKFYRCVNNQRGGFTKYEFMCSETTIWDDDMQNCNHPWAVRRRRCAHDIFGSESLSNGNHNHNIEKNKNFTEPYLTYHDGQKPKTPKQSTESIKTSSQIDYGDRININQETNNQFVTDTYYGVTEKEQKQTQPTSYYIDPLNQQKHLYEAITKASTFASYTHPVYNSSFSASNVLGIECAESGFMGDPNDCRKFYRCVQNGKDSYTRYEFLCGEGTAWDKQAESCNHAWMVKECSGKIVYSTNRENNVKKEHATNESNIISEGSVYNVENENLEKENDPLFISKVTHNLPETTKVLLHPNVETCNSLGYMGSKIDCRRFYRCIENGNGGFTQLEYICDEGTVWDPNLEACNHARLVKDCGANTKNESKLTTSSTESTTITTISFIQTTIQSSSDNQVGLDIINHEKSTSTTRDSRCRENGFMADQYDCRKFYRCVENGNNGFIRYEYVCGDGTAWDLKINACNHLRAGETCGNNYLNEPTTLKQPPFESDIYVDNTYTTQVHNNNIKSTDSTAVINMSSSLTTADKNHLNFCKKGGFIGDTVDCKKFYRCVSNSDGSYARYEFSCGEGTVWDPEIEACNHVGAVKKCGGSLETKQEVSTSQPMTPIQSASEELGDGYVTQSLGEISSPVQNTLYTSSEYTPVASKNHECNSVGYLADKNDCKKFYRCVESEHGGFNRFEFSCGDGTAWDQNIGACNHISSVKECTMIVNNTPPSIGNTTPTQLGSIGTTTQLGYTETTTQSGSIGTSTQLETHDHSTILNYPQHETPTTTKASIASYVCSAEGFYGDPIDCKKFYRCVSNQQGQLLKYEFACGEGTMWDQNIKACNHIISENMNCTIMFASSSTSKPTVTAVEPSNRPETQDNKEVNKNSSTEKHENLPSNVENTCFAEGFYPNVKDCKKFIRCVNNGDGNYVRYDFTCGEGTIWVQDIQACDHENDNSTCSNIVATTTEAHMLTKTTSISLETTSTEQSSITNSNHMSSTENVVSNILQNDECHSEGYYGNSNDCRRFYRCVVGEHGKLEKYDYICGEGTAWDLDTQTCNHISTIKTCASEQKTTTMATNVSQVETTDKTTSTPATNVVQTTDNTKTTISSTTNTEQSQTTENIKTTIAPTTSVDQLQTTLNIKTTKKPPTTSNTASIAKNPTIDNNCNKEGYFGNKDNCKMFYRCVNNGHDYIKYDYVCGEGTIWDQDILTCNHPQDVKNPSCKQNSENSLAPVSTESSVQSTKSTSSSTQISPTSASSMQTTSSTSENSIQGTSNCSGGENSKHENITCTRAGYFPNPDNCKKFYRCVDWDGNGQRFSIFHFECGEGTIWDPALDTCNYEASVYPPRNCNGAQAQTSNSTPSSVEHTTSSMTTETTTQTTQTTQQITSTQLTTQQQTTAEQTTPTTESSTSEQTSSETTTTQSTTTTIEESTTQQTNIDKSTSTQSTSDTTTTTTDQTTISEATTTSEQITTTRSEKSTTTTELTTITEQPSSTTEQSTIDTTLSSTTGQSTTTDETTTHMSTTTQQTSTELSTELQNLTSTTIESSTTTELTQETTTEPSPTKKCPNTENDQYLYACPTSFKRHPKYCNLFYQCLEDNDSHELKIAVFNCPNGTIYDETKIQCVEESKAEYKCEGAIAKKQRFKRLNGNHREMVSCLY